ncbi:MAG: glycosyltransferase family 39 protein [Bryobacteraceae bacterium]|jgi:hypothetical protein
MKHPALSLSHQRLFWLLAILWAALLLPDLGARYSFGWDSSQFDRAVSEFDIARHQPHPPGYPLWVLVLRGLSPIVGNPNRAQVFLALLFTLAALWFFRALALNLLGDRAGLSATLLLAFSPVVCLNANSSQIYAVDLFLSCFAGWLAAELCSGRTHRALPGLAIVALAAGFRPSGAVFLFPLLGFALWRCAMKRPLHAAAGVLTGAVCWLAWLVPTALLTGGFSALAALNHAQMENSFRKTSIFFGAPAVVHAHKVVEVCLYFALALCAFIPPLAAGCWSRRKGDADQAPRAHPAWATPVFFVLWMAPNLALLYLFHCSQPGYLLLSLPPLALLLAWWARGPLKGLGWTAAGLAAALLAGYFPYERFIHPAATKLPFLLFRSTPRISRSIETSQREMRTLIDSMPGRPEEKLIFCLRQEFEAPNIRTVTYDFADVAWVEFWNSGLRAFAPHQSGISFTAPATVRSVAWLCDGAGLPPAMRSQYPDVRRIAGNALYSFWAPPADNPRVDEILKTLQNGARVPRP